MLRQMIDDIANNTALTDGQGSICYSQLAIAVNKASQQLLANGWQHRVCALYFAPSINCVIQYLACLQANIPLLLLDADTSAEQFADLARQYQFAGRFTDERWHTVNPAAARVRSDLALLLTTSGSTGAPKMVMLSLANLRANTEAITGYLPMQPSDVGISSLPLNYSFGLSLLNTHLWVGASFVLTAEPLLSRRFWQLAAEHGITSLSGVPFSYQLLKTLKFGQQPLSTLRYLTQAGGRLPAPLAQYMTTLCQQHGWQFFQMYGQTEATARIAWLPPQAQANYSDCIGIAIPGGELLLRDEQSGQPVDVVNQVGELCYRGPNIMLGYASSQQELYGNTQLIELKTGDLAERLDNGFYRITGRRSRFIKIRGKRFSLDHIEQQLQSTLSHELLVSGQDDKLLVAVTNAETAHHVTAFLSSKLALHPSLFSVIQLATLPRHANGKADYATLLQQANQPAERGATV